uniref:Uncharacterized protein n=1 Tax=Knipowitschia caucasica TaxID=637954 RepID=A0AAV2MS00_KNICA
MSLNAPVRKCMRCSGGVASAHVLLVRVARLSSVWLLVVCSSSPFLHLLWFACLHCFPPLWADPRGPSAGSVLLVPHGLLPRADGLAVPCVSLPPIGGAALSRCFPKSPGM